MLVIPTKWARYAEEAEYCPFGVQRQTKRSDSIGFSCTFSSFSQRSTYSYRTGAVCAPVMSLTQYYSSDCHPLGVSIVVWKKLINNNCKCQWMPCQFISLKFNIAGLWTELKNFNSSADADSQMGVGAFHACKFGIKLRLDQRETNRFLLFC
jgi:hypothetical protein